MRKIGSIALLAAAVVLAAGSAQVLAYPLDPDPWWDQHTNYPAVPSGYTGIVKVFGQPCNGYANDNTLSWKAADNDVTYTVRYHRKLGGSSSSNLYTDVRMHHTYGGYDDNTKRGIYGYNCRYIANTTKYSTHAWGIAVDINSAYEPVGDDACHTISSGHGRLWTNHNWTWGKAWKDCMHFQYATNY